MAKLKNPQTVYTLPAILYAPGAPVWITGGRLLRTEDGLLYSVLTLQVIDAAALKSVTVAIQPLDSDGEPAGLELPYRYLVKAERDARFGETEPILLPLEEAASFRSWSRMRMKSSISLSLTLPSTAMLTRRSRS